MAAQDPDLDSNPFPVHLIFGHCILSSFMDSLLPFVAGSTQKPAISRQLGQLQ